MLIDKEKLNKHAKKLGFTKEVLYYTKKGKEQAKDKYKDKYYLYKRITPLSKYLENNGIKKQGKIYTNFGDSKTSPQVKSHNNNKGAIYENIDISRIDDVSKFIKDTFHYGSGQPIKKSVLNDTFYLSLNNGDLFYKSLPSQKDSERFERVGVAFGLPELCNFDGLELLGALRSNDKSLVIAVDCEWQSMANGRRVLSWQFAFIWGACLCEYLVFDVFSVDKQYSFNIKNNEVEKDDLLDLDLVLQNIYNDLNLKSYQLVKDKNVDDDEDVKTGKNGKKPFTYVERWSDGKPIEKGCYSFYDIKDFKDKVYPYVYNTDVGRYELSKLNVNELRKVGFIKSKSINYDVLEDVGKCVFKNGKIKTLPGKVVKRVKLDKSLHAINKSKFFYIKRYTNDNDNRDIALRSVFINGKEVKRYVKINYYWFRRRKTDPDFDYINTTLLCTFGRVDVSCFKNYAKRFFKHCIDVQKGLLTDKPIKFLVKDGSAEKSKNNYVFPVRLTIRDTMTLAGEGGKRLEALGELLGLEKLDLPTGYSKDDMLSLLNDKPTDFIEYATRDSVVTLLYTAMLFGYNGKIPFSFTSLTQKYFYDFITSDDPDKGDSTELGYIINSQKKRFIDGAWSDGESARVLFDRLYRGLELKEQGKINDDGFLKKLESLEPINGLLDTVLTNVSKCYYGGFNASFDIGYYSTDDKPLEFKDISDDVYTTYQSYDYDIKNCYPTAMMLLNDWDTLNPIAKTYGSDGQPYELTLDDFKDDNGIIDPIAYIFGAVSFEYPDKKPKFPAIPVSRDGCLVFVNEVKTNKNGILDTVWACGPEILRCLELGGRVYCYNGFKLRKLKDSVLAKFAKYCINQRDMAVKIFGKGSLQEELTKLFINALYGKLSQGLKVKKTFSPRLELMQELGISPVTDPVRASMITSLVRACLNGVLTAVDDNNWATFSVTTDGFISNIPEDVLQGLDYGLLKDYFKQSRLIIDGNPDLWAKKHSNPNLFNMTTRGNVSSYGGGVLAKNGFKTPKDITGIEERRYFMLNVLDRPNKNQKRVKYFSSDLTRFKQLAKGYELTSEKADKSLSFNFDMKRKPVFNTAKNVNVSYYDDDNNLKSVQICNYTTTPFNTLDEYDYYRRVSESDARLQTLSDLESFKKTIDGVRGNTNRTNGSERFKDVKQYITFHVKKLVPNDERCKWLDEISQVPVKVAIIDFIAKSYATDMIDYKQSFKRSDWNACSKNSRGTYSSFDHVREVGNYFNSCKVTLCYLRDEDKTIYQPQGVKIVTPDNNSTFVEFTGVRSNKTFIKYEDMLKVFKSFENAEEFAIDIDIEKD